MEHDQEDQVTVWHRLMHKLTLTQGYVVSAVDARGTIWIGYKCVKCGKVSHIHAVVSHPPPQSAFTH
jgi:hypothetical protein